jgi:hypothetical protein
MRSFTPRGLLRQVHFPTSPSSDNQEIRFEFAVTLGSAFSLPLPNPFIFVISWLNCSTASPELSNKALDYSLSPPSPPAIRQTLVGVVVVMVLVVVVLVVNEQDDGLL